MAVTKADFEQAKSAIMQAVSDAAQRVALDFQTLRDQLAAGATITDQDLADLQATVVSIGQIDPAPPAP